MVFCLPTGATFHALDTGSPNPPLTQSMSLPDNLRSGILLPRELTERDDERRKRTRQRAWGCWLCESRNELVDLLCRHCGRPRHPPWLRTYDGKALELGVVLEVSGAVQKVGIVVSVHYGAKTVDVLELPWPVHPTDEPVRAHYEADGLKMLNSVPKGDERETALCDFFYCIQCTKVCRLTNGSSVNMSDKEAMGKKGVIRGFEKDMKLMETRLDKIKHGLERERNFEEFDACRDRLKEMTKELALMERDASPTQVWCPFCAWTPG